MRLLFVLVLLLFVTSCDKKLGSGKTLDVDQVEVQEEKTLFTSIENPSRGKAHLPRLFGSEDTLYMSWVEQVDSLAILKYASYKNNAWSTPTEVSIGTDWFVNWADFPSLVVNGESVLTNILQKSAEGTYDYDIKLHLFSTSTSTSTSSSLPFLLNTDGINAEHGFVSSQSYKDGFSVSWLDGRNTKNKDPKDNQMTLRNAFVHIDGTITNDTEIDARVCDCCNTATAITENGPVVVYRDRSDNKTEVRDMAITRQVNGVWTDPVAIGNDNWKLNGCPVNGPAIDSDKNQLVVSWFTAQGDEPRVMTTFSKDNGATFNTPIRVDSGNAIGRVGTQLIGNETALVSWLEPQGDNTLLQVATIDSNKGVLNVETVANTSSERQSGFPQLVVVDHKAYVAWTDIQGGKSVIKMVGFEVE